MKRKVIKQGNSAFTITLPIEWVRNNSIKENSELEVLENEKSLIISSNSQVHGGTAEFSADGMGFKNLYVHVNALYARGVDEIIIHSKEDISKHVLKSLNNTIGFALISQEKSKYILKDIGGTNYSNLDDIFKRVFQMIILSYESAIDDVFGLQKMDLEELHARDMEVNKFCLFLQRAINKQVYSDAINGRIMFTYSYMLEKIGDEIERLWRANIKYKIKKTPSVKELTLHSKEILGKAFDAYFQFNSKRIEELYAERDKLREESMKLMDKDPKTLRFIRHVVKIAEDAADLSHLILMRKL